MSEGNQQQQQERDKDDAEAVALSDASDICAQLMERYTKSSAPQHRHLLASAVAMRSILEAESLPLTPAAYFAAAISAIDNASASETVDPTALSALLSFLAITLPLVPSAGISNSNASEAVGVLVVLLGKKCLTVSTVRAAVKCLGILLGFCNLEDWGSVQLGFDTLLKFSVDRRPKVRRCAQDSLNTFLNSLKDSAIKKEASKLVFSLLESCMPSAIKLSTITLVDGREEDNQSNGQHLDVLHILNVITLAIPLLSKKVRFKMLKELIKLVNPQYSVVTGHSFKAIELILKSSKAGVIVSEVESIIVSIGSYLTLGDKNPLDTLLSATTLLKCAMDAGGSSIAIRNLPVVCGYMTGLLTSDASKGLHACSVLKELIQDHVDQECLIGKDPCLEDCNLESIEVQAMKSTCAIFEDVLNSYDGDLGQCILDVISALFLKLGTTSFIYMKHILLKLADLMNITGNISNVDNEHAWFASSRFSELVDMLIDLQSPVDTSSQRSRFACFHILLVHSLKVGLGEESNKAFLMLNEIIVALKSAEEDSRKAAYGVLHCISCSLKDLPHTNSDAHKKFVAMISGYLSGASPHVKSGAISALSVLVYEDADICLSIPDLVPSLLSLLRGKAIEVIKAVLGFVKVLVSSLQAKHLQSIISDILLAALPWSSVSRHHFRSKVTIILEILIRKCGYAAIEGVSPDKYKGFIKALWEKRHNKTSSKDAGDADTDVADSSTNGVRDRRHDKRDSLPKKNVSDHHKKRKWEKSSGFVGSKTDNTFTEDGGRSKMKKRAATSNSKSSTMNGLGDNHRANFSRRGAPRKGGKRGIEHGSRRQKERFGVRKPVKASKFNHKSSSSR